MVYTNIALDEMIHAQAKATKSDRAKRIGFTLVELTISIAVIGILMAVLIPTFSMIVNNANRSSAQQSMKTSYEAILAEDLNDNGYSDDYANGVLVFKKSNTKVYYMIVTDAVVGDTVYKLDKVQKSVHAYEIFTNSSSSASAEGTSQVLTLNGTGNKSATTYIVDSKSTSSNAPSFVWCDEGFADILNFTIVTNGTTNTFEKTKTATEEAAASASAGTAVIEDVTDYVAFYSIGEGSVTLANGTAA